MKTKYCLKSTSNFLEINNSHTNKSKSKQTFSFSKSPRFDTIQPYCEKNTYEGDVMKRKNSAVSIGNGKRSDFTKSLTASPGVSKYNLKTLFDQKVQNKGYSLRLSRDKVEFGSYLNKQLIAIPGPTKYQNEKQERTKSPSYSLRTRTRILDRTKTLQPQNQNPGPGRYQNPQISEGSKYASKFSNIGYSNTKSRRFASSSKAPIKLDNHIPGPGNYQYSSGLSNIGKYVVSNHIGGTKAIFDHQKRISKFDRIKIQASKKPGPGHYRVPSEFGLYDGEIYQNFKPVSTSRYSKKGY